MSSKDLIKWGDAQQYHQDRRFTQDPDGGVVPRVRLLSMTPDPLGVIAAMCGMYEGRVVRSLNELTALDREQAFANVLATHLDTPLEAVQLHFLLEGVDRAFTHQLVRQRVGAAYAQESLRFAVVGDLQEGVVLPPSLHGTWTTKTEEGFRRLRDEGPIALADKAQRWRNAWDDAVEAVDRAYRLLVDSGMPAEEARGLLPHATATRVHYVTNLRALGEHAGNRLCTQAQFHWRMVFAQIIEAIRKYNQAGIPDYTMDGISASDMAWQYELIADSNLFRPICYKLGRCPFMADFDRACSIRDRVRRFSAKGVPSDQWEHPTATIHEPHKINPAEWLANPGAARS